VRTAALISAPKLISDDCRKIGYGYGAVQVPISKSSFPLSVVVIRKRHTEPELSVRQFRPVDMYRTCIGQWSAQSGIVKKNVDPLPTSDSTQMRPPYRSMTRWQMARPIPVPEYLSAVCSRLKIPKICCW